MSKLQQRVCRIATLLAWTAFACRAVTPLGYMPAAIGDGGPFILCPSGSQAEIVQFLDASRGQSHHAGHHHDAAGGDHDQHSDGSECPIGASFATAIPATLLDLDTPAPPVTQPASTVDAPAAAIAAPRYHSRAPPSRRSA